MERYLTYIKWEKINGKQYGEYDPIFIIINSNM